MLQEVQESSDACMQDLSARMDTCTEAQCAERSWVEVCQLSRDALLSPLALLTIAICSQGRLETLQGMVSEEAQRSSSVAVEELLCRVEGHECDLSVLKVWWMCSSVVFMFLVLQESAAKGDSLEQRVRTHQNGMTAWAGEFNSRLQTQTENLQKSCNANALRMATIEAEMYKRESTRLEKEVPFASASCP